MARVEEALRSIDTFLSKALIFPSSAIVLLWLTVKDPVYQVYNLWQNILRCKVHEAEWQAAYNTATLYCAQNTEKVVQACKTLRYVAGTLHRQAQLAAGRG
jgi:heme exporter protein D